MQNSTIAEFNKKIQGVWACPDEDGGPYYIYCDGENNITRGWYSSDHSSICHVTRISDASEEEYRLEFEADPFIGFDGNQYDGYPFSSIYKSSDGFNKIISVEDGDSEWGYTLIKVAATMEEAKKVFEDDFDNSYSQIVYGDEADSGDSITTDWIIGTWVNPIEDPLTAFSEEYHLTFHFDGTVDIDGCRNKDHGTYIINDDGTVTVQIDECYYDTPGEGWVRTEGAKYSVTIKKDGANIDVLFDNNCYEQTGSNASNGLYNRQ